MLTLIAYPVVLFPQTRLSLVMMNIWPEPTFYKTSFSYTWSYEILRKCILSSSFLCFALKGFHLAGKS